MSAAIEAVLKDGIRSVVIDGKRWFSAVDVCALLGGRLGDYDGGMEYGRDVFRRLQDRIEVRPVTFWEFCS